MDVIEIGRNMKIGVTGTSCSGKTTLARQLSEYFGFGLFNEVARNYTKEQLKNKKIQFEIFLRQILEELEFYKNTMHRNTISDRTIIDNYIYMSRLFRPSGYTLDLTKFWANTYDIIILCPKLPFVDDGYRCNIDIENDIISFMKNNMIKYEVVRGGIDERFEQAKKIINRELCLNTS